MYRGPLLNAGRIATDSDWRAAHDEIRSQLIHAAAAPGPVAVPTGSSATAGIAEAARTLPVPMSLVVAPELWAVAYLAPDDERAAGLIDAWLADRFTLALSPTHADGLRDLLPAHGERLVDLMMARSRPVPPVSGGVAGWTEAAALGLASAVVAETGAALRARAGGEQVLPWPAVAARLRRDGRR